MSEANSVPDLQSAVVGGGDLEVDSTDRDSALGDLASETSSLLSIASDVARGMYENGRRYHSFGKTEYGFPNDEPEKDRLDMQHAMMTALLHNRLFWCPLKEGAHRVLDLGTGTGIWAIDFADLYPSAEVIGTDLSPIQPSWVPPNCRFEIDDATDEWTFQENYFDFIHNRNFICCIRDWPTLIAQTYKHLKPGGWVEWHQKHPLFTSDDGSLAEGSPIDMWGKYFFEAAENLGTPASSCKLLKQRMEDAGFVNVEEYILKIPVGPWPKDKNLKTVGKFEYFNMTEGVEALSLRTFTKGLGWSPERVQLFLMEVRNQVKDRKVHSYYHFYVVFGMKPESPA
ncbi:uncharacterized protein PV09_03910 [Verruconis gallopava]|uniref:Methyltransferase domain-containing protein n=1 Tax=Verruconis gallopava TaxID=253628 RepID=A0A0D2AFW7_9PEZI|nr:uncharacterized protein PV09_03910 [Verruconis gallopava]KIW05395.1 hypothetical protein PV09_03910 [Verruconis gallopava]